MKNGIGQLLKTLVVTSQPELYKGHEWLDIATTYQEAMSLLDVGEYGLVCADAALTTDNSSAYRVCRMMRKNGNDTLFYEMRSMPTNTDRMIRHYGGNGTIQSGFNNVFRLASSSGNSGDGKVATYELAGSNKSRDRDADDVVVQGITSACSKTIGPIAGFVVGDVFEKLQKQYGIPTRLALIAAVSNELPEAKRQQFHDLCAREA